MAPSSYKFGEFELDCARYELRRNDRVLKLERIPMELLILLAEKDGNVVSRQEIIERLWGKDVFVDTEHGINTAIRKIRTVLQEDAERPRFVQTVLGKGYRFVAHKNGDAKPSDSGQKVNTTEPAETTPKRRWWRPAAIAVLALCLIAGAALVFNLGGVRDRILPPRARVPIRSLAVLPLANLSGDPSQDYFADGMTDELITMLAKNTSLRVVSRTSAMQFKGVNRPIGDIARQLGVDGILEGSIERSADKVHMNLQLIHAPTDTHIWAESYDRDLNGSVLLPSEVSQTVAKTVNAPLATARPQRSIKPEAHDAYLHGRYAWFGEDTVQSQKYFEQAIQLQPDYAAAWSGLADSYTLRAVDGVSPPQEVMGKAEEAARKGIEFDDSVSDAHKARGALYLFDTWDWPQAEAESRRALELDPNNAEAHHLYSYVLLFMQRPEEALREQKRSTELDPFARPWALGVTYIHLRRFDVALNELRVFAAAQPNHAGVRFALCQAFWFKRMWKESEQQLEEGLRLTGDKKSAMGVHQAFETGGARGVEQWGVANIKRQAIKHHVAPFDIATQYAFLGDKEGTLRSLEEAYRERSPWLVFLQNEPEFDFLHTDERYRTLVKNIGLPPAY